MYKLRVHRPRNSLWLPCAIVLISGWSKGLGSSKLNEILSTEYYHVIFNSSAMSQPSWNSKLSRIIERYSTDQKRTAFRLRFILWLDEFRTEPVKLVAQVISLFQTYLEYPEKIVPSSFECEIMVKENTALVSRIIQELDIDNVDNVDEFLKRLRPCPYCCPAPDSHASQSLSLFPTHPSSV